RFLIANLVYPETPADFSNINRLTPDPEALSKRELAKMPRPRVIKSHQYFDPRFPRIIYIVRDPRDVLLSGYYFQRKRRQIDDQYPFEKYAARFMAGDFNPYGSWGDNVASWLVTRYNHPGFLLLRYEDMLANTAQELARVAVFLGIDPDPERIATAVRRSDASTIRRLAHRGAGIGHFATGSAMGTPDDLFGIRAAFSRARDTFRFAPCKRSTGRGFSLGRL